MTKTKPPKAAKDSKKLENVSDVQESDQELLDELEGHNVDTNNPKEVIEFISQQQSYSGPLPPAQQFKLYEETHEGAAKRILDYMDKEQKYRHSESENLNQFKVTEILRGQIMGFVVMVMLISAAIFCAVIDQPFVATVFVAASALRIVEKFIDGRGDKDKESAKDQ